MRPRFCSCWLQGLPEHLSHEHGQTSEAHTSPGGLFGPDTTGTAHRAGARPQAGTTGGRQPQRLANVLAKNFRSRSWLERFAIVGNPSTPEAVLEHMTNEGNQLVRRAAASNLARRASAAEPQLIQEPSSQ